jgi:hypothetical protein
VQAICDTTGQPFVLCSYNTDTGIADPPIQLGKFGINNHVLMQGGDSIVGEGWYNELVIMT